MSRREMKEDRMELANKDKVNNVNMVNLVKQIIARFFREIAAAVGVTERTIERNIKKLKDMGCIKREDSPTKGGKWIVL